MGKTIYFSCRKIADILFINYYRNIKIIKNKGLEMRYGMYNEIVLELNDPVMYQEYNMESYNEGHFAGYDKDGYPYVFSEGGTSYTRSSCQIVKCKNIFLLTLRDDVVTKTNQYREIMEENRININTDGNEQGPFIIGNNADLVPINI